MILITTNVDRPGTLHRNMKCLPLPNPMLYSSGAKRDKEEIHAWVVVQTA
jgi:hypothetical protein